jgi:predicted RNA polymerase sigma factor
MVHGPATGLAMIEALDKDERIRGHYRLEAVRGHLLEKAGDVERAIVHFRAASERTASIPERDYLLTKVARLRSVEPSGR